MKAYSIKKYSKPFYHLAVALLILLWTYSGMIKLVEPEGVRLQMLNQVLPQTISRTILWGISSMEILTALLLCIQKTRFLGIVFSVVLMGIFTVYVAATVLDAFRYTPCVCGGIISKLSWGQHLLFNMSFLIIALFALLIHLKERRAGKGN